MSRVNYYHLDLWLSFGKYSECTLREVISQDPSYFDWCIVNIPDFVVTSEMYQQIQEEFPNLHLSEKAQIELQNKFKMLKYMEDDARMDDMKSYDAYEGDYVSWLGDNG